jgi:hypothetical protein
MWTGKCNIELLQALRAEFRGDLGAALPLLVKQGLGLLSLAEETRVDLVRNAHEPGLVQWLDAARLL